MTQKLGFAREIYGIDDEYCIRCNRYEESWDHIWEYEKNVCNENDILKIVMDEYINEMSEEDMTMKNENIVIITQKSNEPSKIMLNVKTLRE